MIPRTDVILKEAISCSLCSWITWLCIVGTL